MKSNNKSLKKLFHKRYAFPIEMSCNFYFEKNRGKEWEPIHVREKIFVSINDVIVNKKCSAIAFKIEINNFELFKEWYCDDKYKLHSIILSEAIEIKFNSILIFMNHPRVVLDIQNIDHPLINFIY